MPGPSDVRSQPLPLGIKTMLSSGRPAWTKGLPTRFVMSFM